jgi:hypothetical protein
VTNRGVRIVGANVVIVRVAVVGVTVALPTTLKMNFLAGRGCHLRRKNLVDLGLRPVNRARVYANQFNSS